MPSETMDFNSFSSSLHSSQDICSSTEWQAGLWKSDKMQKGYDSDLGIKPSLSTQAKSKFSDAKEVNIDRAQHECSLFSSSLSELFSRKLRLPANDDLYGHSVDTVAPRYEEERVFDSIEELEAQFIGNLLPSDDELLSGVTDGYEHITRDSAGDDTDELDFFSSVGGLDLGDGDSSSSGEKNCEILGGACNSQPGTRNTSIAGENPYGEHASRTLFVRNISSDDEDSELKALFEQFGDIHTFDRACKHHGFVMISYYDIRAAQNAMRAFQNRIFSCKKFDIHYSIPKDSTSKKNVNQGTLAVFLYDSSISNTELHHIFNVYGEIKEIRENPHSQCHWLVEFYDTRAADGALHALNRNDSTRKRLKVEPYQFRDSSSVIRHIHPELEQKECSICLHQKSTTSFPGLHLVNKSGSKDGIRILGGESAMRSPSLETAFNHGVSSSVPKTLPSQVIFKSVGNQYEITESSSPTQLNSDIQAALNFRPHSLPECHLGSANGVHRNPLEVAANINLKTQERTNNMQFSPGNGNFPLPPGNHYKWSNSYQPPGMMWPNSASYFDGICAAPTLQRLHQLPSSPSHMVSTALSTNRHVQSAPLGDRIYTYAGESPDASAFHPGSFANMSFSSNITAHGVDFVPPNIFPHFGPHFHNQGGLLFPARNHMVDSFNSHKHRVRSRRNGVSNLNDMKQYELNVDRIKRGEDNRTTLMIKNIPNKYTSKMLLAAIDERHKGTYDFVYLPIDFKNKCNVGYAFINMTSPSLIIPFYQVFDGKKWEKFNSEKVASLAYARIQGKTALISHFQNSSLMNEDKRCRPILINTDGPNAGDQVAFPMSVNVGDKPGKVRSNTHEVNLNGEPA